MSIVGLLLLVSAFVLVLVLGGVMGDLVARDPGYVLLTYDGMAMETSLWVAVAGLIVGLLLLWIAFVLVKRLLGTWGLLGRWSSKRRRDVSASRTTQGMLLLAEGQWAQAQKALVAGAAHAPAPLVNYLSAARAAAAQERKDDRDALLEMARESTPGSALAVGLVHAELLQQAGEWQASLTLLQDMRSGAPKHPGVQRLYINTLQQLGRHNDVLAALDAAKKSKALSKFEAMEVEAATYAAQFAGVQDATALQTLASSLPKALRGNAEVAVSAGARAVDLQRKAQDNTEAAHDVDRITSCVEPLLRSAIDDAGATRQAANLVSLYGRLVGANDSRAQALARWHKKQPKFPALLLAGAQVDVARGDLSGAKTKLTKAIDLHVGADGHLQMAQLCCAQGDANGALIELVAAQRGNEHCDGANLLPLAPPKSELPQADETNPGAGTDRGGPESADVSVDAEGKRQATG